MSAVRGGVEGQGPVESSHTTKLQLAELQTVGGGVRRLTSAALGVGAAARGVGAAALGVGAAARGVGAAARGVGAAARGVGAGGGARG